MYMYTVYSHIKIYTVQYVVEVDLKKKNGDEYRRIPTCKDWEKSFSESSRLSMMTSSRGHHGILPSIFDENANRGLLYSPIIHP